MSRYSIPACFPHLAAAVGWNHAFATFFAQITDPTKDESDERYEVLIAGFNVAELPTLDHLLEAIRGYAEIPADVLQHLQHEVDQLWAENQKFDHDLNEDNLCSFHTLRPRKRLP